MKFNIPEGFKVIPNYPDFACNKEGKIFNLKTGNFRKSFLDKREILVVPLDSVDNKTSSITLAYIICETFNGLCPYKKRKIVYKDLNPENINPENLCWKNTDLSSFLYKEKRFKYLSRTY